MKVAFFDRDGTIIEDYPDHEWTHIDNPVFLADAIETLRSVNQHGYEIIIITNQYLLNEGFISFEQYEDITEKIMDELTRQGVKILDIFYCPHSRTEGCTCIKPQTGMITEAIKKYTGINIDESFIIGDSIVDVELAINMGMRGFGIGVGSSYINEGVYEIKNLKDLLGYL
ncbi:HAD-IIIA family hydrolase [Sporosarcina sp. YIM B06819]|uniref:D-glycero-alpha-D-manno-heptose-1,7-bisphosphate 7-phosphatase n=1 Tax=Sporosarcina sp. YIM B06819 TaxID=3081769 RepID=UPI00298C0843|nr:HAD-IIIA family hydrolase [Sporosarcina sp. YIM B06819]